MAAMTTPVAELPTTLAQAHALILALAEERAAIEAENSRIGSEMATLAAANADLAAVNQAADVRIAELTAIVKMLERTLYGTRSERLRSDRPSDEQIAFVFDEIAIGVAAVEAELAKAGGKDKPKRAPRPRKEFGAHLERVEQVVDIKTYQPEKRFGDAVKGLHVYGAKVVRPTALACLIANKS